MARRSWSRRRIRIWLRLHRGSVLLGCAVLSLILLPLAQNHPAAPWFLVATGAGLLGAGAAIAPQARLGLRPAFALCAIWAVAHVTDLAMPVGAGVLALAPIVGLAIMLLVLRLIMHELTRTTRITENVIADALAGYLLIAMAFAQLYRVFADLDPTAFDPPIEHLDHSALNYFSITTMASVGFGDIRPVAPFVRMVSALEAVCGLFYMAVVIAHLVGAYAPQRRR